MEDVKMSDIEDKELNCALTKVLNILEMEQEKEYVSNTGIFNQLLTAFSIDLKPLLVPAGAVKDYVGVHLRPVYDDQDFKLLLKSFKNNQTLDAFYSLKILNDAKDKLDQLPNITECILDNPLERGCIVVGDLHGNFNDLHHIIQKFGIPGADYKFVFNGDFVDRGSKQIECLLIILYSFLIRPDKVFINRGNHEDISMNVRKWYKINFMTHVRNLYGRYWLTVFNACEDLFSYLPIANVLHNTITDFKYFIVHGGINDELDLEFVKHKLDRKKFKKINENGFKNEHEAIEFKFISDLLWSDPMSIENGKKNKGCLFNTNRNLGCFFDEDTTKKFCERHGFKALIRSHQVRNNGYSEDHEKCITVFSASHYCDGHNYGAILKFTPDALKPKPHRYKTKIGDICDNVYLNNCQLIKRFKESIQQNELKLIEKFDVYDKNKNGWIKSEDWAKTISDFYNNEISVKQLIALETFLCECDSDNNLVNYKTLFKQKVGDAKRAKFYDKNTMNVIESLFDLLDRNNDKRISVNDAKEALKIVRERLGESILVHNAYEFVKLLDKDKDDIINLDDFKKTFLEEEEEEITLTAKEL